MAVEVCTALGSLTAAGALELEGVIREEGRRPCQAGEDGAGCSGWMLDGDGACGRPTSEGSLAKWDLFTR